MHNRKISYIYPQQRKHPTVGCNYKTKIEKPNKRMIFKAFDINTKKEFELCVSIVEDENEDLIIISTEYNEKKIVVSDEFHFRTFQKFRTELIKNNIDLKCKGALINVYPSPMMSSVPRAYLLKQGEQAKMDSVVNIYEYTEISESISPEKQDLFYQDWLKSL